MQRRPKHHPDDHHDDKDAAAAAAAIDALWNIPYDLARRVAGVRARYLAWTSSRSRALQNALHLAVLAAILLLLLLSVAAALWPIRNPPAIMRHNPSGIVERPLPAPPRPPQTPPALKVFGIGMFKTGTTSLARALEILGFHSAPFRNGTTADGQEYLATTTTFADIPELNPLAPEDIHTTLANSSHWTEMVNAAQHATAFADGPWLYMFREWDSLFPGSKFILTLRKGGARAVAESDLKMWKRMDLMVHMRRTKTEQQLMDWMMERYDNHVAEVRQHFQGRPDQLLEICFAEVPDRFKWLKLATFVLGDNATIPGIPFPSLNTEEIGFE